MPVIFPDIEKTLVSGLDTALAAEDVTAHVCTIKPAADTSPYPSKIVVIRNDGGPDLDHVRKLERVGITIYADTYENASTLARMVEALVKTLTGPEIKKVDIILSPVRPPEAGTEEVRYMTIECVTKGTEL